MGRIRFKSTILHIYYPFHECAFLHREYPISSVHVQADQSSDEEYCFQDTNRSVIQRLVVSLGYSAKSYKNILKVHVSRRQSYKANSNHTRRTSSENEANHNNHEYIGIILLNLELSWSNFLVHSPIHSLSLGRVLTKPFGKIQDNGHKNMRYKTQYKHIKPDLVPNIPIPSRSQIIILGHLTQIL